MRRLLVYGTTVLFVAAAGYGGFEFVRRGEEPLRDARAEQRVDLAETEAALVREWFLKAKVDAAAFGQKLSPYTSSPRTQAQVRATLDSLLSIGYFDGGAYVVDATGHVAAASSSNTGLVGLIRDGSHIRAGLDGGNTASEVLVDSLHKRPIVEVVAPLTQTDGKVSAVVVGMTFLDDGSLRRVLDRLPPASSGLVAVIDSQNALLNDATYAGSITRAGLDTRDPAAMARKKPSGFMEYKGEGGLEKVAAFSIIADGWSLSIIENARTFHVPTQAPTRNAAVAGMVVLVALSAAIPMIYERALRAEKIMESSKRAFLAIAGHELRTPLTVIRGFGQTLLKRWDKISDPQRKDILQTISRQSRNLEVLVERLMVASQLDAGVAARPMIQPTDIVPILERSTEHHRALSAVHEVTLSAQGPLLARVDAKFLEQALNHVIENAIKFSPAGGLVEVSAKQVGSEVSITVTDEGVGLPSDISGIFEKFGQSETVETRTHEEGGVGLGLYIARSHIAAMHGSIEAKRRKERGARFVLKIPAA